ncbi:MAG: hypothetical protein II926_05215 [Bacteroidales bacterium]|nr:hypothetical protein [Bacteroidales bacterium]
MKQVLFTIIIGLICFDSFCQTDLHISDSCKIASPTIATNLFIGENAVLHVTSSLTVNDSLIVYGTLINEGVISAKQCVVNGGSVCSGKPNKLIVQENLTFNNATTTSYDTIQSHIVSFSAQNTIINGHTNMESGYLETNDLIIHDTLEFSGKLGVKTIFNNLIINGTIENTANENIQIHGNLINNNETVCERLNVELFGNQKNIIGKLSFKRLDLETDTSIYTNTDSIAIMETFSGNGTLIQNELAYLKIQAPTTNSSPHIIANAVGNTVEYCRGGTQYITTNECFNLIVSKRQKSILYLSENLLITNQLILNDKAYIDCDSFELCFPHTNENSITLTKFKYDKGIIISNGKIHFDDFGTHEQIFIPLFTTDWHYAGISLENLDESHATLTIDSLFNFVTHHGDSSSDTVHYEFVNTTWHISSDITNAILNLEWNENNELELFDNEFCSVYHSENKRWIAVEPPATKSLQKATGKIAPDGYFTVGNTTIILPIELEYFTLQSYENHTILRWKQPQNAVPYTIEKSNNGIEFYQIAIIQANSSNLYSYTDIAQHQSYTTYYRLKQISIDGEITYSPIICAAPKTSNIFYLDRQSKTLKFNNIIPHSTEIYNIHGLLILKSSANIISLAMLPHGMYSIIIQTDQKTFQQKMIW